MTNTKCERLKAIFRIYEDTSGQVINYNKSEVFFSNNVDAAKQTKIANILGVFQPLNTSKYLGLTSMTGRNKAKIFGYLKDRLWKKVNS